MRDGGALAPSPRPVTRGESPFPSAGFPDLAVSVDWLSISFTPKSEHWRDEVAHFLRANFSLTGWEDRGGFQGYERSACVDGAVVAWGGASQKGSVYLSLPGSCVASCTDFSAVVEWLETWSARITRLDIAGDDYYGKRISFDWGRDQLEVGGFTNRGRKPTAQYITHSDDGIGNTMYVGARENGKYTRLYEKGKQLGDRLSKWTRFEVEWRAKDRVLPYDMLLRPAAYLAGAFPCAAFWSDVALSVRTFKERAVLSYQRVIAIARLHAGRAVNAALQVTQGDLGAVVDAIRRAGIPARLNRAELRVLTDAGEVPC